MKRIVASRKNDTDWSMHFIDDKDYDKLFSESVFVSREDGSPLMVLLKNAIPTEINAQAWSVLKSFNPKTENRSTASGIKAEARKKEDGTYSKVTRVPKGWEVISGVIGFFERTVRMPYAHACAWNLKSPEKFQQLMPLVNEVDQLYKEHVPKKWREQRRIADATPADYLIGKSSFTTLTVNKNFRTSCHKDVGDLPEGFSCMTVIKQGAFNGGHLVLPNYRIAAELGTGDLILFDPHEFHGNTQIIPLTKNYVRCSIVYYFREMLQYCKPPKQELARAKNRQEGDALYD